MGIDEQRRRAIRKIITLDIPKTQEWMFMRFYRDGYTQAVHDFTKCLGQLDKGIASMAIRLNQVHELCSPTDKMLGRTVRTKVLGNYNDNRLSVRFANWLRNLADYFDPLGSGDLNKMNDAAAKAMDRLERAARYYGH